MNIKGLGKKQIEILRDMQDDGLVIRMVHDYRRQEPPYCSLDDDEGMNSYEKISNEFLQRLFDRDLLTAEEFNPCLGLEVTTFRIKKGVNLPPIK